MSRGITSARSMVVTMVVGSGQDIPRTRGGKYAGVGDGGGEGGRLRYGGGRDEVGGGVRGKTRWVN